MKVLDRYQVTRRGWSVVLHERAKRGDLIRSGDRVWPIIAIETYCIMNPPLPWGFLLGETAPEPGEEVTIEKGPNHDTTPWPREDESSAQPKRPPPEQS
jgi:hypothetical protein